jgi:hypothetical protein
MVIEPKYLDRHKYSAADCYKDNGFKCNGRCRVTTDQKGDLGLAAGTLEKPVDGFLAVASGVATGVGAQGGQRSQH